MGASANNQVRYIEESTAGTTPAGSMLVLPFATFDPDGSITREQAGNVMADRQPTDHIPTEFPVSAQASCDGLYDHYLNLEEAVMGAAYAAGVTVTGTTISAAATGNKLVHGTTGSWDSFVDGDFVDVSGLTTNGTSFVARVNGTPSGTDLVIDTAWKTLVNESAGATVTVKHAGRGRIGNTLKTGTFELWNSVSSHGQVLRGVGTTSWQCSWPHPNKAEQQFQFTGMTLARISAQLGNATTSAAAQYPWNTGTGFGHQTAPTYGGGFRYGGTLLPNLHVAKISFTLANPIKTYGANGSFAYVGIYTDERFSLKVDLSVCRDSSDAEDLIDDAYDIATVASLAFVQVDAAGKKKLFYFPQMQIEKGKPDGLKQNDKEMVELSFVGRKDSVHSLMQVQLLG